MFQTIQSKLCEFVIVLMESFWWKILGEHVLWKYVVENFGWRVFGGRFDVENKTFVGKYLVENLC